MRKTLQLLALLWTLGFLYACQQSSGAESDIAEANQKATSAEPDYWLLTDPEADIYNYIRTSAKIDGKTKLLVYNAQRNTLLVYDTQSRELEKKIQYDNQGPNALNALFPFGSIEVLNKDSILFYSLRQSTLSLSDYEGNIYKRTRIRNDSVGFGSVSLTSSMALKGTKLWMQSLPNTVGEFALDYQNRPNMFGSIDLNTGLTQEHLFEYPKVYSDKTYSQRLQMATILYNQAIDKFIISFPLSHDIHVTDFKGNTKTYPAKSKLVNTPIETDKNRTDLSASQLDNHYYWINDSYGELFYDATSGYYFREVQKGISEADLASKDYETEKEILVLDKNFKVVTTIPHHGGTLMYRFFKDNTIYWNANFNKYNFDRGNEDTIYFEKRKFY